MSSNDPDVLVVGGGPAGSIAAGVAAEGGAVTTLVDKKSDPSQSSACGGLVSKNTWDELGAADGAIVNEIKGVEIHPPEGESFVLSSPQVKAYVIDRDELNADLLARAEEKGVRVNPETGIFERDGARVTIRAINDSEERELCPEIVIGADGPRSDVRRLFGLESPSELLYAIQGEIELPDISPGRVEVFFGRKIAPGFFGWIIPVSSNKARVGLATKKGDGLKDYFQTLLDRAGGRKPADFRTGVIPIGVPDHSCGGKVLTVGDAAGQVKPTTGGGLYPISIASKIAGEVTVKSLSGLENPSRRYYERWMDRFGHDLKREMLLHRVLESVSDDRLGRLLNLLNRPKIADWVSENGDIDHLYPLAKKMAKNPLVLTTILKALPGELASKLKRELAR
ncbi:NAD(P)/FAD-dependent oxidoreductase [Candidatus Bipolaricaulota bacterium]|nr:NAD(P)/FAD-dependent oxidoreductase [Candidatus Bipolaricaulota bacterium]